MNPNRLMNAVMAFLIGLALLSVIASEVSTLTGTGGTFENTTVGSILDLAPIIIVVGLVGVFFLNRKYRN